MKQISIGLLIGIVISTLFFLTKDFFTTEIRIPGNHVTIRLLIDTKKPIEKIVLTSTHSNQTIELYGQTETVLIYPNSGEGEFKVCCLFKDGQELCSQRHYVEAGYSPTLKIKETEIETIDFY